MSGFVSVFAKGYTGTLLRVSRCLNYMLYAREFPLVSPARKKMNRCKHKFSRWIIMVLFPYYWFIQNYILALTWLIESPSFLTLIAWVLWKPNGYPINIQKWNFSDDQVWVRYTYETIWMTNIPGVILRCFVFVIVLGVEAVRLFTTIHLICFTSIWLLYYNNRHE